MTVKLFFQGIEMHVDTEDVAAVVRQLNDVGGAARQRVPKPTLTQIGTAGSLGVPSPGDLQPIAPLRKLGKAKSDFDSEALHFLRAIKESPPPGINGEKMAKVLSLKHAKGIGSKATGVNKTLGGQGFKPEDVYGNSRDSAGVRHWTSGPMIDAAIEAIQKGATRA